MPDASPTHEPGSRFTITNTHLALLIMLLGLLATGKGAVSSYVVDLLAQERAYAEVSSSTKRIEALTQTIAELQKADTSLKDSIIRLEGGLEAEKSRAYEADQQQGKLLDIMRQMITLTQPQTHMRTPEASKP